MARVVRVQAFVARSLLLIEPHIFQSPVIIDAVLLQHDALEVRVPRIEQEALTHSERRGERE
jgi:hypothetical protein